MTLKELSQLYNINREIDELRERLTRLRSKATSMAPSHGGGGGGGYDKSKVERYAAEIVDIENIIGAKLVECVHEQAILERYIADIDDSLVRRIMAMRFVDRLSWQAVAFRIGGDNTEESVKKMCYRYIRKNNQG